MKHLYKTSIWQGSSGLWFVNDIFNLTGFSNKGWVPCRILAVEPAQYVQMLITEYKARHFSYNFDTDVLLYSWDNYNDAHRYQLFINRTARQKKFMVE